jgi:hypothetical protein
MFVKYLRFIVKKYLFSVIALVFVSVYWYSAGKLPERATVFPRIVTIIMIPLFVWNFILSIQQFRALCRSEMPEEKKWTCSLRITKPKLVLTGMTVLYVILIPILGYCVTTLIYIPAMTRYLGVRKPVRLVLFAVILFSVLYSIFGLWLRIRLPSGLLI